MPTLPKVKWSLTDAQYERIGECYSHYANIALNVNVPLDGVVVDRLKNEVMNNDMLNSCIMDVFKDILRLQETLQARADAIQTAETEEDLRELALEDIIECDKKLVKIDETLAENLRYAHGQLRFLDVGVHNIESVRLAVEPGVGGTEAALFARDLFGMYERWVRSMGWRWATPTHTDGPEANTAADGMFIGIVTARPGEDAFAALEGESGVHRVQRVPVTDRTGRLHTSAAAVRVAPIVDVNAVVSSDLIREDDIQVTYLRAGTAGGQRTMHVESGCRLHHIPSKTNIEVQAGRSKGDNEKLARAELAAMIVAARMLAMKARLADMKGQQVSGTDRSDKIRTYNFDSGRVIDHRTGVTGTVEEVLQGDLDPFAEAYAEMQAATAVVDGYSSLSSLFEKTAALNMPQRTLVVRGNEQLRTLIGPPI